MSVRVSNQKDAFFKNYVVSYVDNYVDDHPSPGKWPFSYNQNVREIEVGARRNYMPNRRKGNFVGKSFPTDSGGRIKERVKTRYLPCVFQKIFSLVPVILGCSVNAFCYAVVINLVCFSPDLFLGGSRFAFGSQGLLTGLFCAR